MLRLQIVQAWMRCNNTCDFHVVSDTCNLVKMSWRCASADQGFEIVEQRVSWYEVKDTRSVW